MSYDITVKELADLIAFRSEDARRMYEAHESPRQGFRCGEMMALESLRDMTPSAIRDELRRRAAAMI